MAVMIGKELSWMALARNVSHTQGKTREDPLPKELVNNVQQIFVQSSKKQMKKVYAFHVKNIQDDKMTDFVTEINAKTQMK